MRFLACLFLLAISSADGVFFRRVDRFFNLSSGDDESIRDQWFLQKLDHSDPTNPGTWWQRYQTNDKWFNNSANSPVFLMIGGEGEIPAEAMNGWAWTDYAATYGALCFQLEHRFYGKSQPTGDLSVKSLRYLTSEQALADLAYFIEGINRKYNFSTNKWVVFGGSYPGSLAAWARLKYPHLIHAAVSSSALVSAQMYYKGYNEVVRQCLTASSPQCAINVHQAALEVEDNLKKPGMAAEYSKKFNLCSPLDSKGKGDVAAFIEGLAMPFQEGAQYYKDNDPWFQTHPTLNVLCNIMTNKTIGTVVDRYAAASRLWYSKSNPKCIDASYHNNIVMLQNETTPNDDRSWRYQTCTQIGCFQTSTSRDDMFGPGVNSQIYVDKCKAAFGDNFDANRLGEGVKRWNILYGGKDAVNRVTNVFFINGSLDPWRYLGVNNSTNPKSPAILIEGTAHCADMFAPASTDPPQLVEARKKIKEFIGECLSSS